MRPLEHQSHEPASSGSARGWAPRTPLSDLQLFFLRRLTRLLRLRRDTLNLIDAEDWHTRLLHRSIYATYCECLELSIGDEARRLFDQEGVSKAQ